MKKYREEDGDYNKVDIKKTFLENKKDKEMVTIKDLKMGVKNRETCDGEWRSGPLS